MFRSIKIYAVLLICMICSAASSIAAQDKNLTAEEILARHLKSFGSADALSQSKNRMAVGRGDFTVLATQKTVTGKAILASNGSDLALFSTFDMADYRMERIGLFDNKISIPYVDEAHRSPLGTFLNFYDKLLGGRIFGGSVFSTWCLYGADLNGAKIDADGKKKVGDREAWVVKITPKGGLSSGSYIKLYFDAKDFHHVRTVYRQSAGERGFFDTSGHQAGGFGNWDQDMANNGSTLTEDFDDFRSDAAGISLPHK